MSDLEHRIRQVARSAAPVSMAEVVERASGNRRRTSRRLRFAIGAAALAALLAVLAPWAVARRDEGGRGVVAADSGLSAGPGAPSRDPLRARIDLDATRAVPGTAIHGYVVITNDTGGELTARACAADWLQVGLANDNVRFEPPVAAVATACTREQWPIVPTGTSRWPVTVQTSAVACAYADAAVPSAGHLPPCVEQNGGAPGPPPLPSGRYDVQLLVDGLPVQPTVAKPLQVTLIGEPSESDG